MRDPDGWTYFKEEVGGLVVGGFEPDAKPWRSPSDLPYPFEFQLLEEDWEHFAPLMEEAVTRIPALAETGIRKFYNGPEAFTPDNQFLLGEAPGLRGYFVGAGFNSVGIASAGGAGRALAEWIVEGEPTSDLVAVDVRRFAAFHGDEAWLRSRVAEILGLHYEVPWPLREPETGRPQRVSPLHERMASRGAVFGSRMGWERPLVFAPPDAPAAPYTWGRPDWLPWCLEEQRATRERVAVFDQTSFSLYDVTGADAVSTLQWVCAADVDVPVGGCVYTPFLNERGTYEADLTVTRTGPASFLLVSSSATTIRDLDWIRRHLAPGADVAVVDRTDELSVIGVMGPRSRELLGRVSAADWSDEAFPFATSQAVRVGEVDLRATRMTYVGEVGWELVVRGGRRTVGVRRAPFRGRGSGHRRRGLPRDRVAAAREGLPRVRSRPHPRPHAGRGGAALRDGRGRERRERQGLPRASSADRPPRPPPWGGSPATSGVVRRRGPRADGVGRRAAAA